MNRAISILALSQLRTNEMKTRKSQLIIKHPLVFSYLLLCGCSSTTWINLPPLHTHTHSHAPRRRINESTTTTKRSTTLLADLIIKHSKSGEKSILNFFSGFEGFESNCNARHTCIASDFSHVTRSLSLTKICMGESGPLEDLECPCLSWLNGY